MALNVRTYRAIQTHTPEGKLLPEPRVRFLIKKLALNPTWLAKNGMHLAPEPEKPPVKVPAKPLDEPMVFSDPAPMKPATTEVKRSHKAKTPAHAAK